MSLIKSHKHFAFEARFQYSQKVTFESLEIEEGLPIDSGNEYRYTYNLIIDFQKYHWITFICSNEPKIEAVNNLLKNILKRIYKLTFTNGLPNKETSEQQYEQIIKDSIKYTSFKHLIRVTYEGQRHRSHLIRVC